MENFNIQFICGAVLAFAYYGAYAFALGTMTGWRPVGSATRVERLLFGFSWTISLIHEGGHWLASLMVASPVVNTNIGCHYTLSEDGTHRMIEGADALIITRSGLKLGFIAAGPLLILVPLSIYFLNNPFFSSSLINGILCGHLFLAGIEVFWSPADLPAIKDGGLTLGFLLLSGAFLQAMASPLMAAQKGGSLSTLDYAQIGVSAIVAIGFFKKFLERNQIDGTIERLTAAMDSEA